MDKYRAQEDTGTEPSAMEKVFIIIETNDNKQTEKGPVKPY